MCSGTPRVTNSLVNRSSSFGRLAWSNFMPQYSRLQRWYVWSVIPSCFATAAIDSPLLSSTSASSSIETICSGLYRLLVPPIASAPSSGPMAPNLTRSWDRSQWDRSGVQFSYDCPIVRSAKVADLFVETSLALEPVLQLAAPGSSNS